MQMFLSAYAQFVWFLPGMKEEWAICRIMFEVLPKLLGFLGKTRGFLSVLSKEEDGAPGAGVKVGNGEEISAYVPKRRTKEQMKLYRFHKSKKLLKNTKKMLAKYCKVLYNDLRCELIAMKREVATQHYRVGFPWSECQVMIPGDKSLYRTKYFCESRNVLYQLFGRLRFQGSSYVLDLLFR
ncbi:MAG: hypothetical protein E7260_07000 [Lachnospiraceae bacterium]|nr:hypothetical protein [Lachnospiraceae bacterium]